MRSLRNLMTELTGALGQATVSGGSGTGANPRSPLYSDLSTAQRKRANRGSLANLEAMWNTQLQALWKNVERSQKFLPAIPGRHIVLETGNWVELDSATWKARRPVHIFLLNDHLMVAAKKRKRIDQSAGPPKGPVPTKLVAEECWPIQDIDIVDLGSGNAPTYTVSDGPGVTIMNAISIRASGKTFTYRHDRGDHAEKTNLIMSFRKAVEELRKLTRVEVEASSKTKDSLNFLATRDIAASKRADVVDETVTNEKQPEFLIDVDGKQKNLRWVEGQIDDLDIEIALQRFNEAVDGVERLRKLAQGIKSNATAQGFILTKLDVRASKLATILLRNLVDTPSFLGATKTTVGWLSRLGFDDQAREAFLGARSEIVTKRARYVSAMPFLEARILT